MNVVYSCVCLLLSFASLASAEIQKLNSVNFDESLKKNSNNWLIMFETTWCGKPCEKFHPVLNKLDSKLGNQLNIATVGDKDALVRRFDIQAYPTLIYLRKGQYYVYTHAADEEDLTLFCAGDYKHNTEREIPEPVQLDDWIVTLTDENFETSVLAKRGAYWAVLFHQEKYKGYENVRSHLKYVADDLAGKINIAEIDGQDNAAAFIRLEVTHTPTLFVFRGGKAYRMDDPYSYQFEDMKNFVEAAWEKAKVVKEIKPTKSTTTITNEEDPNSEVKILTDETFDSVTAAMTGKKGTWFVEFYAPWCGHCKMLAPIWEELAHTLRERMNVAKLDCTANANSTERFGIPGFPILLLFQGGKYYQYDGEHRTAEAILNWAVKGYKEKEGRSVPPPVGTPLPPPTVAELVEDSYDFILDSYEYDPQAVLGIVGLGAVTGSAVVMYVSVLLVIMRAVSPAGPAVPKKGKGKKGTMPMKGKK